MPIYDDDLKDAMSLSPEKRTALWHSCYAAFFMHGMVTSRASSEKLSSVEEAAVACALVAVSLADLAAWALGEADKQFASEEG